MALTAGKGVDVAIEAVGIPATFDICQAILAAGGRLANVGVHGQPVTLHLERLWARNITLTTRLVDTITTPMLLRVVRSGRLDPGRLVTTASRWRTSWRPTTPSATPRRTARPEGRPEEHLNPGALQIFPAARVSSGTSRAPSNERNRRTE